MRKGPQLRLLFLSVLVLCALPAKAGPVTLEDTPAQKLDRQFQSAVAQYNAGQFAEAAAQLEKLLPQAPQSFEVQELLGLVYAAQSQDFLPIGGYRSKECSPPVNSELDRWVPADRVAGMPAGSQTNSISCSRRCAVQVSGFAREHLCRCNSFRQ